MKKKLVLIVLCSLVILGSLFIANVAVAGNGTEVAGKKLFSLNIIGVPDGHDGASTSGNGHRIFVPLNGTSRIYLKKGDDFSVLDGNGVDDGKAKLQLPDPGLDPYIVGQKTNEDTVADYSVYVRPLGKPNGLATITTCAEINAINLQAFLTKKQKSIYYKLLNSMDGDAYCSIEQVVAEVTVPKKGNNKFQEVTAELLTIVLKVEIYADEEQTILLETFYIRVPIFDSILIDEYWKYENEGLKVLQVRFYEGDIDVSEADADLPPL